MPRYVVYDAEKLKQALLYEVVVDSETAAIEAVPAGTTLPRTGAFVLRKNGVGPRYVSAPSDPDDEIVVVGAAPPSP